jgi:hypothetical protein
VRRIVIDEVRHEVGFVHSILVVVDIQQSTVTESSNSIRNYTLRYIIVIWEYNQTIQPTRGSAKQCSAVQCSAFHSPSLMDSSRVLIVALCTGLSATVTSARMSTIE